MSVPREGLPMAIDTSAWDEPQLDALSPPPDNFTDMSVEEAANLIKKWFLENFEDPVHGTPHDDGGGYLFVWGPYDHRDVISHIFAEVASKEIIEAAIVAVDKEEVVDWAPAGHRVQPLEDEGDSSSADDTNELHARMLERITVLEEALENLSRPGIGHNQPPEPLEDEPLTDAELQALLGSTSLLKSQPVDPSDKRSEVIEAANVLESLSAKVTSYLAQKGDLFVTEAVKAVGTETGKWATRLALWALVGSAIVNASNAVFAWLHSLPWAPF